MTKTNERTEVLLEKVKPDVNNPRQEFDPEELQKLEKSIEKDGVLNPLVVEQNPDGTYLLVDGERRYRASKNLGLKKVPVTIVEPMSSVNRMITRFQLQERTQSWTLFEKALAIQQLQNEGNMTNRQIGQTLGFSDTQVERYIVAGMISMRGAQKIMKNKIPYDFVIAIGRILRDLPNGDKRGDMEDALIEKVNAKVVMKSKELRHYRMAMQNELHRSEVVEKIIADPKYSSMQAMKDSKTEDIGLYKQFNNGVWIVEFYGEKILAKNNPSIMKATHDRIDGAIAILKKLKEVDFEDKKGMWIR